MMNLINKIALVSLVFISWSCSDKFLELEPKVNQLEANAYITEEDAFEALVAVYNTLSVQPWVHVPMQSDLFSDDAYTGGEPGGGMPQYQEQETSLITLENGAAKDLWNKLYSGVYRANFYLSKEAGINWESDERRKRFTAEARVIRAYFYWDLVRHYGWVPLIKAPIEDIESVRSIEQSTPDQIYEFVIDDLVSAIPDLPLTVSSDQAGRITKDVARVLITRIHLYHEGFVKDVMGIGADLSDGKGTVINKGYVQPIIDEIISSGRYRLLDNYADVFDWGNENNEESIFEWQYSENGFSTDLGWGTYGNFSSIFYGPRDPAGDPTVSNGWSFGMISWSLYDEFEAGDPRRDVSIYDAEANLTSYSKGFQNTGYFNYKYLPRSAYVFSGGGANRDANLPINYKDMRLSEVYLIGAELHLDDNPTLALEYVNKVRVRAMGESAKLTSLDLDDIYHERRVELSGEGHRKWDLLRRGLTFTETAVNASWDVPASIPNANDFTGRQFIQNTWGMLPIPISEIRLVNEGVLKQFVPAFQ